MSDLKSRFRDRRIGHGIVLPTFVTGSTVYGFDLPSDLDLLCLNSTPGVFAKLIEQGWKSTSTDESGMWQSLKKGWFNIILTRDEDFVRAWLAAHDEILAHPHKGRDRSIRVTTFKEVFEEEGVDDDGLISGEDVV